MAKSVTVEIQGLKELGDRLQTLSSDVSNRIARAATAAGAVVVRNAAQQKAPVSTGNLKKNIIVKRLPKSETPFTSEHIVTVRSGKLTGKQKGKGLKDAFYGRFIEHGTAKMAAQPFMRPAFDENKEKAVQAITDRIRQRIEKVGA